MSFRAYRVPGVYRRPAPRRSAFPRVRTDVVGFVGVAGPAELHRAVRLDDWRDYEAAYLTNAAGDPVAPPLGSKLAAAVRAYFANGGARCWVVNVGAALPPPEELMALLLGQTWGAAPSLDGAPLSHWGLELLFRQPEVAMVVLPELFATRTRLTSRVAENLPPRFEEGCFADCGSIAVVEGEDLLPPDLREDGLLFSHAQIALLQELLVARCARDVWRCFAILSTPPQLSPAEAMAWKQALSPEACAAIYWPWVLTQEVPGDVVRSRDPAPYVAGALARADLSKGPHRAPAGVGLLGVVGLEHAMDDRTQGQVYDAGVNVLRGQPRKGPMIWGARTLRWTGPESVQERFAYINVRRGLSAIERSCERLGQRVVFDVNSLVTWLQLAQSVSGYLGDLFRAGVLEGDEQEQAFFVRADRSNNPPETVDAGMLVCEVGVAIGVPAEFIVFRLGRREGVVEIEER